MGQRIEVTCYAGYKADERPTSFTLENKTLVVLDILDRWYDQDSNYFSVLVEGGTKHLLRHDLNDDFWELVPPRREEP